MIFFLLYVIFDIMGIISNDIYSYIIREYPLSRIRNMFNSELNELVVSGDDIYDKMSTYSKHFGIVIENNIINIIMYDINRIYDVPNVKDLSYFICEYMSMCIPTFKVHWYIFKKNVLFV